MNAPPVFPSLQQAKLARRLSAKVMGIISPRSEKSKKEAELVAPEEVCFIALTRHSVGCCGLTFILLACRRWPSPPRRKSRPRPSTPRFPEVTSPRPSLSSPRHRQTSLSPPRTLPLSPTRKQKQTTAARPQSPPRPSSPLRPRRVEWRCKSCPHWSWTVCLSSVLPRSSPFSFRIRDTRVHRCEGPAAIPDFLSTHRPFFPQYLMIET